MAGQKSFHESFVRDEVVAGSSDRSFGIVFAVVFAIIALFPLLGGSPPRWWAVAVAGLFLAVALVRPALLQPLNRLWMRFGLLLHRIVNPVVMGVLFYGVMTPVALVMRLAGRDHLRLRFDPEAETYWLRREPPGPPPDSMKNQF